METWKSVLLAVGAMVAFAVVVIGAVLAVMYFQDGSLSERLRHLRRR